MINPKTHKFNEISEVIRRVSFGYISILTSLVNLFKSQKMATWRTIKRNQKTLKRIYISLENKKATLT